jgi:hypothetical protein
MLVTLRQIVQEVIVASHLEDVLDIILRRANGHDGVRSLNYD